MKNSSNKYLQSNQDSSKQSYSLEQEELYVKLATLSFIGGIIALSSIGLSGLLVVINLIDPIGLTMLIGFITAIVGTISGLFASYKLNDLDLLTDVYAARRKAKTGLLMCYVSFLTFLGVFLYFVSLIAHGR